MRSHPILLASLLLGPVGPAEPSACGQEAAAPHRFLFKEREALEPWPGRIALRAPDEGAARAAALSAGCTRVEPTGLPGWFLAEGGEAALAALSTAGDVFALPLFRDHLGGPLFWTETFFVAFDPEVPPELCEALLEASGSTIEARDWAGLERTYRMRSDARDGRDVLGVANALALHPWVRFAEPDYVFSGRGGQSLPNDPGLSGCWGLHNVGQGFGTPDADLDVPEAWGITSGAPGIPVLVLETGVQLDHPDLHVAAGKDFTGEGGGGGPVGPCDNHGTQVAGCLSALADNGLGGTGVAPGCPVLSGRCFSALPGCDGTWMSAASWTVLALDWGWLTGGKVSNNSNTYGFTAAIIEAKYQSTKDAGMVHFACAGNDAGPVAYPASLASVNAVAAIWASGERVSFSNHGPQIDFSAPGAVLYTTDRTGADGDAPGDYEWVSGTSFATPHAAGVAALLLSFDPALSPVEVETILRETARDLGPKGHDPLTGWGLLNAFDALLSLLSPEIALLPFAGPADAHGPSSGSRVSADGKRVAFESAASNLVPGDRNGARDVFARDLGLPETTRLVSVGLSGEPANGDSRRASISSDGRYVAFVSEASNLVPGGDNNEVTDVFVRDLLLGTTVRASVTSGGEEANGLSQLPQISGDGRWVAFQSVATNLAPGLLFPYEQVFVHDLVGGTTTLASTGPVGIGNAPSLLPSLSHDGSRVAFASVADNLIAGDGNGRVDIYVRDLPSGPPVRVSTTSAGLEANHDSWMPSLSGDGQVVAFYSVASNLVPGDDNELADVFVHAIGSGATARISQGAGGQADGASYEAQLSYDGRYVAFESDAQNLLMAGDTNAAFDVFLLDSLTGALARVSVDTPGGEAAEGATEPGLGSAGGWVSFSSPDGALVAEDHDGFWDVFLRQISPGNTQRVSVPD